MSDIEEIRRSRNHQRDRVKQVKKARNQNADGMAYWRERAIAAEAFLVMDDTDRDSIIEECAANLAIWYPDNANTNAFCAAIRSMKSKTDIPAPGRQTPKIDYMLRGGPGFDYPCANPNIIECAAYECQEQQRCRIPVPVGGVVK